MEHRQFTPEKFPRLSTAVASWARACPKVSDFDAWWDRSAVGLNADAPMSEALLENLNKTGFGVVALTQCECLPEDPITPDGDLRGICPACWK